MLENDSRSGTRGRRHTVALSSTKSERAIIVNPVRQAAAILVVLGALLG
jgi:hypothetical protein